MKAELVARAKELGFDICRVAAATRAEHVDAFREWIGTGAHGEMEWMARGAEKRGDVQQVLPGAKSVVVLGMNYYQSDEPRSTAATTGRIARYAWGDDYHDVVAAKLKQLDALMTERGGRQKHYVDTGPVLERDFAAAAGVGWHGKSTMLINRELGTWFFLAEIFTTLELEADEPQNDRCGSCTRCIDACPTNAITPHRLDARRCISYLTIELKGSIPVELRPLIGDRIYGCDACLDVCPWNRFAQQSRETSFRVAAATRGMTLREFLALDDNQFRTLFRKSPIKRTKRRGFLRNVCVALGNVGTRDDLPALERAERDPEPLIAEHARWAIAQIQARDAGHNGGAVESKSARWRIESVAV